MRKNIWLGLLLLIAVNSCKKDTAENAVDNSINLEENQQVADNTSRIFKVNIEGQFKNDDKIIFYYLLPEVEQISAANSKNLIITGSNQSQNIDFELPEEVLPTRIFFRFGENGEQKIIIKKVSLRYGEHEIHVPDSLFNQFFNSNQSVIYNKEDYSIESVIDTENSSNPMFFSREMLEDKIDLNFY